MEDSFKGIVFNKIVDEILDIVAGTSKQGIENLINENKCQRILGHCIEKIAKSNYFKTEYRNVSFILKWDSILGLSDDKLDASLPKKQIAENIKEVINNCFVDDNLDVNRITDIIVEQYIQHAKAAVQVYDVIKQQHEYFENIDGAISEVKLLINSNKQKEEELLRERQMLLKKELKNEVDGYLSDIMNKYLYFVCKGSTTFNNPTGTIEFDFIQCMMLKINEIINNIEEYVKEDFCAKDIEVIQFNGLEEKKETVEYFWFMECGFKNTILENTKNILNYKDIIDLETYVYLLRIRNSLNGPIFPSLYKMQQSNIINNPNITIDVQFFRSELMKIGEKILALGNKFR